MALAQKLPPVLSRRQIPTRIKHTIAPPHVCQNCHWEKRFHKLVALHKKLRSELLKASGGRSRREEPERDRDDESPPDVTELFKDL